MCHKHQTIEYALKHKLKNPYFIENKSNFIKLIELIVRCKSGYARSLSTQNKDLLKWINDSLPLLQNSFYQISTKCYWILNGLKNFPQCKYCGKLLIKENVKLNSRYRIYCSISCEVRDNKILEKNVKRRWEKYHQQNIAFTKYEFERREYRLLTYQILSYMNYNSQLEWIVENRIDACIKMISSKHFKYLKNFIFNQTEFLNIYNPLLCERIFCVINHITSINDKRLK